MKKHRYSTRNDINFLSGRLLKKDIAKILNISISSVSRYANGKRKIPKHVLEKAADLRFITPKRRTNHIKLKKKRVKKVRVTLKQKSYKVFEKLSRKCFIQDFNFSGRQEDLMPEIMKISAEYGRGDNIVYSVIVFFRIGDEELINGSTGYPVTHLNKLLEKYQEILKKYKSHLKLHSDTQRYIIRRTEYI